MNFNNVKRELSKEEILSKLDMFSVWRYYIPDLIDINKAFLSPLRVERTPSAHVFMTNTGNLIYKDFGNGDSFDIFGFICKKYNCSFPESLKIISNDMGLVNIQVNNEVKELTMELGQVHRHGVYVKQKSNIEIISQPWGITDFNYWNQYGITFDLLNEYNVFAAKTVYLTKGDRRTEFNYSKSNPCYAYRFCYEGNYSYKIYFPLSKDKKFKWLFSGGTGENVEGEDQLNLFADILILTKSLKDCICYRQLNLDAISLQGEANRLDSGYVNKLLKRFNKIIVNYDNDEEGIRGSKRINNEYNFKYFFIDKEKDLSDYIKNNGVDKAREMIKRKLYELENE